MTRETIENSTFLRNNASNYYFGNGTENDSFKFRFVIRCVKCDATAPNARGGIYVNFTEEGTLHDDRAKVIEAWNRRTEQ